ncbi:MAG: bifunctional phosphoglucose/phosphomannose isomerase [Candidatus Omnitrophica bacterium]|nr:bifunctional phosphoglucose/phosphomannose isomerase [Candidatus Omnitrophota bacterium]
MSNLDDLKIIAKYDRSGMLETIEGFPAQCRDAKSIGYGFDLPASFKIQYKNIVSTGLGGSAIGSDIARSYIADDSKTPLFVNRNYRLPGFVGERTLVIASSYSGNTEETISAYKDAKSKEAKVIAITSGGELRKLASGDGFPVLTIPGGLQPRCALGYSFFPLLIVLSKIGVVKDQAEDIDEAIEVLNGLKVKSLGAGVPEKKNIAKRIARSLYNKFPVIYAGGDHTDSVVTRWRGSLSENAKVLSSGHVFPEMNHNEIMGWEHPAKLLKDFAAVILRDSDDNPRVAKRMDITKKILAKAGVKAIEVNSLGSSLLARIFSLIYIGDFVSFYLAILNKRDPTPVERIAYLKKELAKA